MISLGANESQIKTAKTPPFQHKEEGATPDDESAIQREKLPQKQKQSKKQNQSNKFIPAHMRKTSRSSQQMKTNGVELFGAATQVQESIARVPRRLSF